MQKNLLFTLLLAACLTGCSSDTIDGDAEALTRDLMEVELADGTSMFFIPTAGSEASVTYDQSNPLLLNSLNRTIVTTYVGDVEVPSSIASGGTTYTVTGIADCAFINCTTLQNVVLPATVKTLGKNAFSNCTGLKSVNIPEGVTAIPDGAFMLCTGLTQLELPQGITSVGDKAFWQMTGIETITLPEGLTTIGGYAFARCTKIRSLTVPSTVTKMGGNCFLTDKISQLHMKPQTPPELTDSLGDNKTMVVYVPQGAKAAYEANPYWNQLTIEEE